MRGSSLPNVNGHSVVSHSNARSTTHPLPNVSRSWSSRELQVRHEERLARSVGDRSQEKRVLEWCRKNNVSMVRKLPKLDSAILTARGIDLDKFMTFVEDAPIVKKGPRAKPYDAAKERNSENVATSTYCQFCQREVPSTRRSVFFTSPYECEYCGNSNDIVDTDDNVSSMDSESCTSSVDTVHDTIRRGNARVIDHRTFHEKTGKSAKVKEESDLAMNEEMDIFWRNDASEYFEQVDNVEDELNNLSLLDGEQSVFLTEACVPANMRPSQAKIAWDDEDSTQFAEINRTIATDDELHKKDFQKSKDVQSFERHSNKGNSVCLSQENDILANMKIRIHSRTQQHNDENESVSGESLHGEKDTLSVVNQQNNSFENSTICSPVANRSVALSRLALIRLSRANRLRSKSSHGPPVTQQKVSKEAPQTHSCGSSQSYSFLDAVSPEIKSFHERKENEKEDEEMEK